jgi:acetyl-CoA C-acetyltransferase
VNSSTPVIIGVGQALQRDIDVLDALEPAQLMAKAVAAAFDDAHLVRSTPIDLAAVVALLSWNHDDAARLIEADLGLSIGRTALTNHGGNSPQALLNWAGERIQRGELDMVLLVGGECTRTKARAKKQQIQLAWRKTGTAPDESFGSNEPMFIEPESRLALYAPVQHYPMFETALRHHLGHGFDEHQLRIASLWSRFSQVAATNPFAWNQTAKTAQEIATVSPSNRMIGLPYPKQMNSNNDVDMAAAVIVCSQAKAEALGVPRSQWVFPQVGADAHETYAVSHRRSLHEAPAIAIAGARTLAHAGLHIEDIDLVDLYSCFPVAVQIGAAELGLPLDRQLTLTGGLPFAGGPWNNYVMHAIATMVGAIRQRPDQNGLVWANGGYLTKHSIGVYASEPLASGFARLDPQDEIDALGAVDVTTDRAAGSIEGWTVMHNREGNPERAYASIRTDTGQRAWATSSDHSILNELCDGDWVSRRAAVDAEGSLIAIG